MFSAIQLNPELQIVVLQANERAHGILKNVFSLRMRHEHLQHTSETAERLSCNVDRVLIVVVWPCIINKVLQ